MVVSEPGCSTHKPRFCQAHLASLLRDAPSPGEVQGKGFCRGRIHREEEDEDGTAPSSLSHLPAGFPPPTPRRCCCWLGGRRRAAPAWRNAAIVRVSPSSFPPGVTAPAWGFSGFSSGTRAAIPAQTPEPRQGCGEWVGWVLPGPAAAHLGWLSAPCSVNLC